MTPYMIEQIKEGLTVIQCIAEGYPITATGDEWIAVANPNFQEDNGSMPNLVLNANFFVKSVEGLIASQCRCD